MRKNAAQRNPKKDYLTAAGRDESSFLTQRRQRTQREEPRFPYFSAPSAPLREAHFSMLPNRLFVDANIL